MKTIRYRKNNGFELEVQSRSSALSVSRSRFKGCKMKLRTRYFLTWGKRLAGGHKSTVNAPVYLSETLHNLQPMQTVTHPALVKAILALQFREYVSPRTISSGF
eukprot:scaffold359_cov372-Pavlova_lutheri.AAC.8